jgi:hypothetical protein
MPTLTNPEPPGLQTALFPTTPDTRNTGHDTQWRFVFTKVFIDNYKINIYTRAPLKTIYKVQTPLYPTSFTDLVPGVLKTSPVAVQSSEPRA